MREHLPLLALVVKGRPQRSSNPRLPQRQQRSHQTRKQHLRRPVSQIAGLSRTQQQLDQQAAAAAAAWEVCRNRVVQAQPQLEEAGVQEVPLRCVSYNCDDIAGHTLHHTLVQLWAVNELPAWQCSCVRLMAV